MPQAQAFLARVAEHFQAKWKPVRRPEMRPEKGAITALRCATFS
jgi:hypothetical protein